uniref:Neur_chan_LBD domain-containing protein n=1 Tax=Steinernema glaseri TaxID=37863 RepID=A0A1I8AQ82_9BILA
MRSSVSRAEKKSSSAANCPSNRLRFPNARRPVLLSAPKTTSRMTKAPLITRLLWLIILAGFVCGPAGGAKLDKRCTRNSINLGHIIDELLKDYDTHLLPESEGVNVTIELHVQVGAFSVATYYRQRA